MGIFLGHPGRRVAEYFTYLKTVGGTAAGSFDAFGKADGQTALEVGPYASPAGVVGGTVQGSFSPAGSTYALQETIKLTNPSQTGGAVTSFDANLSVVPEPAITLLLGFGMLGAGVYGRYFRRGRKSA
ncbi:MAG: PEP-CTERM sorting domain-containing protein [Syntrophorhabdales bacterium]|jgi:hypothetical protein